MNMPRNPLSKKSAKRARKARVIESRRRWMGVMSILLWLRWVVESQRAERARLAVELAEAWEARELAGEAFDDHYGEVSGCHQCQEADRWEEFCDIGQSLDVAKESTEHAEFKAEQAWRARAKKGT